MSSSKKDEALSARVLRIRFSADDSPWKVLVVETDDRQITVVGEFEDIQEGLEYSFQGKWTVHPRYGEQFRAENHYPKPPRTVRGMVAYLSSGLITGIGPKMAKRIVDRFGEDTFEIISKSPERLTEIPGIAQTKKDQLVESFNRHQNLQEVVTQLTEMGLSANMAVRLYREYGDETVAVVRQNPYRLSRDIFGIGFRRADEIARASGVAPASPMRIQAAIEYILQRAADRSGHTYLPRQVLLESVHQLLTDIGETDRMEGECPSIESMEKALDQASDDGIVHTEGEAVYLIHYLQCERHVARRLAEIHRAGTGLAPAPEVLNDVLARVQHYLGIDYADEQEEAVRWAFRAGVLVITGGPGTGKTTIVHGILKAAELLGGGLDVVLAAPTGRAARKLSEVSGHPANTIHRLLGYSFIEGRPIFRHNAEDPLEGDVLIVDETSMVDIDLAFRLLDAVPAGMRVIFVGDADQLPSVGPGNFLRDLIGSGFAPVVRLEQIFRQEEVSDIVLNAHRINDGKIPTFSGGDSFFVQSESPDQLCAQAVELVDRLLERGYGIEEVQVLSPMHRGACGVGNLNVEIQKKINPPAPDKAELARGATTFRMGDKVMCLRNNYEKGRSGIFNGNLGIVEAVLVPTGGEEVEEPTLMINFDGEQVPYPRSELDEITLAYATTVHKAQGSEFPAVLAVVSTSHYIMLQRNLIYTAVTRAEEKLLLLGQPRALQIAIRNNSVDERYSLLADRLSNMKRDEP